MSYDLVPSPLGPLLLTGDGHALTGLYPPGHIRLPVPVGTRDPAVFGAVREQLVEYFAGERLSFDLPLAPGGTAFQQRVWAELCRIGYGATSTYSELAVRVGRPAAVRAVGSANGRNPISIVVPCHRVVGRDGALTGYAGGLAAKRWLLDHEGEHRQRRRTAVRPTG
jgi:methylated-DNA-[protein]-cysteine S-methyltransferase